MPRRNAVLGAPPYIMSLASVSNNAAASPAAQAIAAAASGSMVVFFLSDIDKLPAYRIEVQTSSARGSVNQKSLPFPFSLSTP